MGRTTLLTLVALTLFLAIFPLTLGKPGLPAALKSDEPAYYLMALSLAFDFDLRAEVRDMDRLFQEFPFRKVDNLILMTDDGWKTVFFGKPYIYSALAAPLARFFGANGLLCFNLLLLAAMIWMGALYLARFNDGGLAALFSSGFFLLSNGFAYTFWLHPEVLSMASVAACLFFAWHRFGRSEEEVPRLWQLALSGALLAPAAYNKPMLAALGVPVLIGLLRAREWRRAGFWLFGAVFGMGLIVSGSLFLTGHPTSYLGVRRQGVTVCEPGVMPIAPAAAPAVGAPAPGAAAAPPKVQGTGGAWSWIFLGPDTSWSEVRANLGYFLWGRHAGLFVYSPLVLIALALFLLHGRRHLERWLLLGMLAVIALFFIVFIPDNWQGGGGFVGNRYFVIATPAFLFLVTRLTPRWLTLAGYALGSLFLGPILFTPFGAGGPEPTLQSHVRNAPFRFLPLELTLKEVPGYDKRQVGDRWFLGRRDVVLPSGERLWVRGASRTEIYLTGETPLKRAVFEVRNLAPHNRLRLELDGAVAELAFEGVPPEGEARRVVLEPEHAFATRHVRGFELAVNKLVVTAETGRIRPWTRVMPPNSCPYFPQDESFEESFFVGAELTYLGSGEALAQEVFTLRWGVIEPPSAVGAGATFRLPVRLFNQSGHAWVESGAARVKLAYHWRSLDGEVVVWDGERTELPLPVEPGQRVSVEQLIRAPARPGRYALELDPVFEGVAWFSERNGGQVFRAEVEVLPAAGGVNTP